MHYNIEVKIPYDFYCPTCDKPHTCHKWKVLTSSAGIAVSFANKEGAEKYIETYTAEMRSYGKNPYRIVAIS